MNSSPPNSVSRHRDQRRAAGLKLKQVWVPDIGGEGFLDEIERQCRDVATRGDDGLAFAEAAAGSIEGWT